MAKCSAHRQDGQPCNGNAIRGGNVCYVHGGAAPQVKRKAEERIKEARNLSIEKFIDKLTGGAVDPKVLLEACVKLTELTETLEGRVARREEHVNVGLIEREIQRLEVELATHDRRPS